LIKSPFGNSLCFSHHGSQIAPAGANYLLRSRAGLGAVAAQLSKPVSECNFKL
jgi:hypothetical protein